MNALLPIIIALPLLFAVPAYALGNRKTSRAYGLLITVTLLVTAMSAWMFLKQETLVFSMEGVIGMGLHLKADGFRSLYALVASFMWLMTSLFTPQYMSHGHSQARYCLFTLLTLGATVGVFLSNDLITAFMFFEILSFTSYCWVIHEQNPGAMRAGETYLAIAILGGMAMLMGIMMLHAKVGSLDFDNLGAALRALDRQQLYLPGALILAGFGAKAGMFPLHVWLPKAHPVAPAPASALLSGVLTKVGVFGILALSTRAFPGDETWGSVLVVLGLVNMLLGAVLALFSVDLKRTLACSSMSQIGFILFGIGFMCLLADHNALAAQGTVLHMLNHSLIKLVLFMAAGVVYLNTGSLSLNDIRGYGRKKPLLMLAFLVGAASISGISFFSGYASKTLLHESAIEYIVHLKETGHSAFWFEAAEWAFVITGGLTFCYMLKLFICLFIEKHPARQTEFDAMGASMKPLSMLGILGSAILLLFLGLRPEGILTRLANRSLPFLLAHEPAHAVEYLAWVNLSGGLKSLIIGAILYPTLARRRLMRKDSAGVRQYINRWPEHLDLENSLYRPLVSLLEKVGVAISRPLDLMMERLVLPALHFLATTISRPLDLMMEKLIFPVFDFLATAVSRFLESLVDSFSLLLMRTVLKHRTEEAVHIPIGNRFTFHLGRFADRVSSGIRKLFGIRPREPHHFVLMYAAVWNTAHETIRRMLRTLSFSLILFALGFIILLAFLLVK